MSKQLVSFKFIYAGEIFLPVHVRILLDPVRRTVVSLEKRGAGRTYSEWPEDHSAQRYRVVEHGWSIHDAGPAARDIASRRSDVLTLKPFNTADELAAQFHEIRLHLESLPDGEAILPMARINDLITQASVILEDLGAIYAERSAANVLQSDLTAQDALFGGR